MTGALRIQPGKLLEDTILYPVVVYAALLQ